MRFLACYHVCLVVRVRCLRAWSGPCRRAWLPAVLLLLLVGAAASAVAVVEDWTKLVPGSTGVPAGWIARESGRPAKYELTVVKEGDRAALLLKSTDEHSMIAKELTVNLKETPILQWSWKVTALPAGADLRKKETCDSAAEIYVVWRRFPEIIRSQIIGYAWDTAPTPPKGDVFRSPKTPTVTYFVLQSGDSKLGQWVTERRNVLEDYRRIFNKDPDNPSLISLSIDTNDTRSKAESLIGNIVFMKP